MYGYKNSILIILLLKNIYIIRHIKESHKYNYVNYKGE
jgi:hypothetical protein